MEHPELPVALALGLLVAVLSVLARRLAVATPVLMLCAGAALAFVPGLPAVALDPELVLTLLLPPLLYFAGVGMSWRGFRANLRPILLLAVGCVLFTATAVAAVAHYVVGLPWAVGFVLGAIVSPPDAVAPMAVLRAMRLPRRLLVVLEGESLVNDATALVAFGLAIAAVSSGTFSVVEAATRFAAVVTSETIWGIAVGWAMLRLRHLARDPRAELLLSLATPFIAFWPPHAAGGSGVVACVAAGLWVSWNGRRLIRPATRLQGYFIWDLVTWGIEALVFLLTGLQARTVLAVLSGDGWTHAVAVAAAACATVVVVRFVWVFPVAYGARLLPRSGGREPMPDWRLPFVVSFAGLRGVVSLTAALLVPATIDGRPFPERETVLFATYCVIAFTIVALGTALPRVVRALGLDALGADEAAAHKRDEQRVRIEGVDAVLAALDGESALGTRRAVVEALRRRHADRRAALASSADACTDDDPVGDAGLVQMRLLEVERTAIGRAYARNRLTDEARRRIERELDLEEARLLHSLESTRTAPERGDPGASA